MVGDLSASSTTKTGRHDIAEILLKVALNTKNQSIALTTFGLHLEISVFSSLNLNRIPKSSVFDCSVCKIPENSGSLVQQFFYDLTIEIHNQLVLP